MVSKTYVAREGAVVWGDTLTPAMTLNNLATTVARMGAQKDLGAGSTPEWFTWRLTVQFETAPVVGETIDIYISTSDGGEEDGQEGTANANIADNNSLKNMTLIGHLLVTSTDTSHDMTASGICRIPTRYFSPVVHNTTADNLKATNDTSELTITPIPPETQ